MHLVCHQDVPGTSYTRGQVVSDPAEIDEIKANDALYKVFSAVPDDAFPRQTNTVKPVSYVTPPAPPSSTSGSSSTTSSS